MQRMLIFFLLLNVGPLSAAELPPAPPALRQLLREELAVRELGAIDVAALDIVPAEDGESYLARVGTYLFVLSADGSFILPNYFFEYATPPLDSAERARLRAETLRSLDEARMIVFAPPQGQPVLYTLTVFTDTVCPFCLKFHHQVDILTDAGVKVRYLAYPKEGLYNEDGTPAVGYQKIAAVWCSPQPRQALSKAFSGKTATMAAAKCDHPVEAFFSLGESFGVVGTPTLVFDNGDMWTGYYSAIDILEYLGNHYFPARCEDSQENANKADK